MTVFSSAVPLARFEKVNIGYGTQCLVPKIDWQIDPGSLWGVIGPNGAGKTTLLRTLLGFLKPLEGIVSLQEGLKIGYVKQRDTLNEIYPFSVSEIVMMGCFGLMKTPGRPQPEHWEAVVHAMEQTGIAALKDMPARELSGGQKQRVLIARALASRPNLIILDEPTNDMDIKGEQSVLSLIRDIHEQSQASVILVSHLLHTVLQVAEQMVFLREGDFHICSRDALISENHLEEYYQMPIHIEKYPGGVFAVVPSHSNGGGNHV